MFDYLSWNRNIYQPAGAPITNSYSTARRTGELSPSTPLENIHVPHAWQHREFGCSSIAAACRKKLHSLGQLAGIRIPFETGADLMKDRCARQPGGLVGL